MKRYLFYLRPQKGGTYHQSKVYFCVMIARSINNAIRKFSKRYGSVYCGMMKIANKKFQVYFIQGRGPYKEELLYVVIEEDKTIFGSV
ncbi:hypothetical protein EWI07_03810 [Sporolactobacillus sp. THM7-4]|nr:hypothetical protein EWI07_03810 [Sporolactobacillus sp. THM7-4]